MRFHKSIRAVRAGVVTCEVVSLPASTSPAHAMGFVLGWVQWRLQSNPWCDFHPQESIAIGEQDLCLQTKTKTKGGLVHSQRMGGGSHTCGERLENRLPIKGCRDDSWMILICSTQNIYSSSFNQNEKPSLWTPLYFPGKCPSFLFWFLPFSVLGDLELKEGRMVLTHSHVLRAFHHKWQYREASWSILMIN